MNIVESDYWAPAKEGDTEVEKGTIAISGAKGKKELTG